MSEKLSKPQARALKSLGLGPVNEMSNHVVRFVTAESLVNRGLATWTRFNVLTTASRMEWEITITDKGRAVLSHWAGTERWLRMTGAAR